MWSAGFGSTIMRGLTTNLSRSDKHKSSSSWSDTITIRSYTNLINRVELVSNECSTNLRQQLQLDAQPAFRSMPHSSEDARAVGLFISHNQKLCISASWICMSLNFSTSPASERTCEHVPTAHTDDVSLVMQRVGWLFRYGLSLTRIWEARIWWKLCPADLAAPGMSL